jgi:cell division septation protein DedD
MSNREAAPLTVMLFARKGNASASGFVQAQPINASPPVQTVQGATPTLAALYAASVVATVLAVASWYDIDGEDGVRDPPEHAVASMSSASQHQAGAEPEPAAGETLLPLPPPPLRSASISKPSAQPLAPRPGVKPAAGARRGWRVQLVSLGSAAAVRREWTRLRETHRDVLRGLELTVKTNRSGSLYRLQAGPLSNRKAANRLCATIKRRHLDCIVVRR